MQMASSPSSHLEKSFQGILWESSPGPREYEAYALPLSYAHTPPSTSFEDTIAVKM